MKNNGNNKRISDYYIGLDIGTNSVGWAVTDTGYNILRFKGQAMWGMRLFEEAVDASQRRMSRTSRRRIERQHQRIALLEMLFFDEISKIDSNFFHRLHESALYVEDKTYGMGRYALFNDKTYTDADYLRDYPTIYHLRNELIQSTAPHDVRLVYLAIHHIIKNRGHFLYESNASNGQSLSAVIDELNEYMVGEYGIDFRPRVKDRSAYENGLSRTDINLTVKKKLLRSELMLEQNEEMPININVLSDGLAGAKFKLADLFFDDSLKDIEVSSLSLKDLQDETMDKLADCIGDGIDLILHMKSVYDTARLSQILGGNTYISEAKIALYQKNKADLKLLKKYVKEVSPSQYKMIFSEKTGNGKPLNNYAAYSRYKTVSLDHTCNQEEFCAFLKGKLPKPAADSEYAAMFAEIDSKTFLPKLRGSDNSVIPNQLHLKELEKILENASQYLNFLNEKDENGISVREKILSVFRFKIPYYVGPLNSKSDKAWLIRSNEKIYPWNFEKVVDIQGSAEAFIINLVGKCGYTGKEVIPKDSLLYSEYMVLNELNPLKINGQAVSPALKNEIFHDLFVQSNKKVTKKSIEKYLMAKGYAKSTDVISGVDVNIKARLKSWHDLKDIIQKTDDTALAEEIIRRVLIFGEDKKLLRGWLKTQKVLDRGDIDHICKLKYADWGRLSREFLTEIYHVDENGEAHSIMDMLRSTNLNLMQLLSHEYQFAQKADEMRRTVFGAEQSTRQRLEEMRLPVNTRRSVWQALKIVDEIVDIRHSAPTKIFIEVSRGNDGSQPKGTRTISRKDRLLALYQSLDVKDGELLDQLSCETEQSLRRNKLYLYYTQLGRCMYSGERIEYASLFDDNQYDRDHIYPQSRVVDDSLDNLVLVKKQLNHDKSNLYPLESDIRSSQYSFWKHLKGKGLISEKKFQRLTRSTPLTDQELSSFVARQLVETQQSTKAVASVMRELYPETRLVYSKAMNVDRFKRDVLDYTKCREVNDCHHAKDAYLNIVVGNVYDTKFTDKFFLNIQRENYSLNKVFAFDVPGAWQIGVTIDTVRKNMAKFNMLYTRMPYETKGIISDLQILPAGKGQLPIKRGLSIEKYGGYNNVYGAYFCIVEHKDKKGKKIRTIEPVYIYAKPLYEKEPIRYCTEVLQLTDPKIICSKILKDALLEINGQRLNITGRTGSRNVYKHAYQMSIDQTHEKYMKDVMKYIARCKAENNINLPFDVMHDGISFENNLEMYDWFIAKAQTKAYREVLKNSFKYVEEGRELFPTLVIYKQCVALMEILKAFKCDRQMSNLSLIDGKSQVGMITYSSKISGMDSVKLINQSVTGLYEIEVDLLK